MSIYARGQQVKPLTEQQKRIKKLRNDPYLLERLADRRQSLPDYIDGKPINVEQLLRDLSQVYLGMSDARYPMD